MRVYIYPQNQNELKAWSVTKLNVNTAYSNLSLTF